MGTVQNDVKSDPGMEVFPAQVEALLKSADWESRLQKARLARDKVLAERAKGGVAVDAMRGPRPWEKASTTDLAERRRQRAEAAAAAVALRRPSAFEIGIVAPEVPSVGSSEPQTSPGTALAVVPNERRLDLAVPAFAGQPHDEKRGVSRAMRVGMAFALGLGLGLGGVVVPGLIAPSGQQAAVAGLRGPEPVLPATTGEITDLSAVVPVQNIGDAQNAATAVAVATPPVAAAPAVLAELSGAPPVPAQLSGSSGFPENEVVQVRLAALQLPRTAPNLPEAAPVIAPLAGLPPAASVLLSASLPIADVAADAAIQRPVDQRQGSRLVLPAAVGAPSAAADTLPLAVSFTPADVPLRMEPAEYAEISLKILSAATVGAAVVSDVREKVTQAGFPTVSEKPLTVSVKTTHVRFYHAEDAGAAAAAAASVGVETRDFTTMTSPPPPGTVEVWIAGKPAVAEVSAKPAKKAKKASARRSTAKAQPQRDPVQALRDRIAAQLRNGDHL